MRERYQEFQRRGAEIIAIAPDTPERTRRSAQSHDLPFPCLADPDRRVYRQYDVRSALISLGQRPALFVLDGDGIVRYAHLGWQQWEIPTLEETLRQLDALEQP